MFLPDFLEADMAAGPTDPFGKERRLADKENWAPNMQAAAALKPGPLKRKAVPKQRKAKPAPSKSDAPVQRPQQTIAKREVPSAAPPNVHGAAVKAARGLAASPPLPDQFRAHASCERAASNRFVTEPAPQDAFTPCTDVRRLHSARARSKSGLAAKPGANSPPQEGLADSMAGLALAESN